MKDNNILIIILIGGLVIVSVMFAFNTSMPDTLTIAENEQKETITVSESVDIEFMPDKVEIYVEIETQEETAKQTKDANAVVTASVLKALHDYGIGEDQIETTSYYLSEQKKWDKDKEKYIITGYQLSHVIRITTDDIEDAGEIIDTVVDVGATGINSINFGLSDNLERELKAKALSQAAQKAESKAQAIVEAVGVKLGDFVSISESGYYTPYYPMFSSRSVYDMGEEAYTSISPEEVTVSGTVTLVYEIEQ